MPEWCRVAAAHHRDASPAEIEIAIAGSGGKFSAQSDCRVLVVPSRQQVSRNLVCRADLIFAERRVHGASAERSFAIHELGSVLQRQLGMPATSKSPPRRAALAG
jgi:hypothetical protein